MSERKDRLIQTRVPEKLESTLKQAALERRTTVSQMIRNILEDTFDLVDGVVASVDAIVSDSVELAQQVGRGVRRISDAKARTRPPCRAPLADAAARLAGVHAWQAVVLNRASACARCGLELPRGSEAYRGVGEDPAAAESFVCAASVQALAVGEEADVRERAASWLSGIDTALESLERTLWTARDGALALGDRAASAWEEIEDNWLRLEGDLRELGAELGAWPRRLERLVDAGWMLAGVAASYRLHPTHAALLPEPRARAALARLHARNASRFAQTSARQGAGMLKVGQLLSTRPDLLPEVWIRELSQLQDAAPPVPFAALRQRIEADLGGALEAHFSHFDAQPMAAASIGVVHRATTHSGVDVAVKITRPDVRECLELDLDLLELFLESVKPMFPPADYPTIVAEIRAMLRQELDYRVEARMMERLADFFAGHARVVVPRTLPELCGHDVLVSHFCAGRKITLVLDELRALRDAGDGEAGARLDRILSLLLETYARQILVAGVFQADPHPGNFLVTDDDRLVLLDFGCTRTLAAARARPLSRARRRLPR